MVETLLYYRIWTDQDDAPVGVTVDYEYAEDVHFELDFSSWLAFLQAAGIDGTADPDPGDLENVLLADRWKAFEDALVGLKLPYRKVAFY